MTQESIEWTPVDNLLAKSRRMTKFISFTPSGCRLSKEAACYFREMAGHEDFRLGIYVNRGTGRIKLQIVQTGGFLCTKNSGGTTVCGFGKDVMQALLGEKVTEPVRIVLKTITDNGGSLYGELPPKKAI